MHWRAAEACPAGKCAELGKDTGMQAGKKVPVTGADGFIGSRLVESPVRSGYQTRALVAHNSLNS